VKCLIAGGTGFIGRALGDWLRREGHEVTAWGREPKGNIEGYDAVVNLMGEPIAQRWNAAVKRKIRDSRIQGTARLVELISKAAQKPRVFVGATAIGIYGDRADEVLTETSSHGAGFLVETCEAWENAGNAAAQFGVRVLHPRIGFALGRGGGALKAMTPPFRMGVGGRLGSGRQWMPWIHIDDICGLIAWGMGNEAVSGVYNATAPKPVRNSEFTAEFARVLHRPAIFPVPPIALKVLFGELAQHMLDSARVIPEAAMRGGYRFRHPELPGALKALFPN
jgi:uncharacterized protein (TIGR01777 family)